MNGRKRLKLVQQLGRTIPTGFPCKANCGKCCRGAITLLDVEWAHLLKTPSTRAVLEKGDRDVVVATDPADPLICKIADNTRGWCPFLGDDGVTCQIYEQRPFVCRQYGQTWLQRCQEGVVCPPELDLPDEVYVAWGRLAGVEPANTAEHRAKLRSVIERWRALDPTRVCALPSAQEMEVLWAEQLKREAAASPAK